MKIDKILASMTVVGMMICGSAQANWNSDWAGREKININTSEDGAAIKSPIDGAPILVRLHTGNFAFSEAKPDGSDLRFIADDDKTPLKFHIEQYDNVAELALIWVDIPKIAPGSKTGFIWLYYNNSKAPAASDPKTTYDTPETVVFHFDERNGAPKDSTAYGNNAADSTATVDPASLIGNGLTFNGSNHLIVSASSSIKTDASGLTVSMWIKPDAANANATLFRQVDGPTSISLQIQGAKLIAAVNGTSVTASTDVAAGAWHHVAMVVKEATTLYLDGEAVGKGPAAIAVMHGSIEIGSGFTGGIDEFQLATTERSADWIRLQAVGQGVDQHLITYGTPDAGDSGGSPSYFKILLGSVTVDGWVVIGILMVMMVISFAVMILKALFITRASKANAEFDARFSALGADLLALDAGGTRSNRSTRVDNAASMYNIYLVGSAELRKRIAARGESGQKMILSSQSIDAIRASLDARLIREIQRLNSQMVLLTIAISGGPFLGLLGTVVGVMITFAAIAAAGDVNVNAIAPGIAAALVATVAGLAVAIPSLFGYNYLASKNNELTNDMRVFVDKFVTRLAENYSD